MTKAKSSKNTITAFKNYDEAVNDFIKINNDIENLTAGMIISQYSSEQTTSLIKQHTKSYYNDWFSRCVELSTPWPEDKMIELLDVKGRNERMGVVLKWCRAKDTLPFLRKIIKQGMSPLTYIESSKVTPLGFAAYSLSDEAFKIMMRNCKPPKSRLYLTKKDMGLNDEDEDDMAGSTLLHRMGQRYSLIVSGSNERHKKFENIINSIAKYDPKCFSIKTEKGELAEEMAIGKAGAMIQNIRKTIEDGSALKKNVKFKNQNTKKSKIF